jgi:hypothetical protein
MTALALEDDHALRTGPNKLASIRPQPSAFTTLPVAKRLRSMGAGQKRLFPGIVLKYGFVID